MARTLGLLIAAAVTFGMSNHAYALVITEMDRTTWEGLAGGPVINDPFDLEIAQAQQITFDSGVISTASSCCVASTNGAKVNRVQDPPGSDADIKYRNFMDATGTDGPTSVTWTFPMPVIAFGADWLGVNTIVVSVQGQDFELDSVIGSTDGFLGFISDTPIASITFSKTGTTGTDFYQVDNLAFVKAAMVPEPGTLAILAIGIAGISGARRKRRLS